MDKIINSINEKLKIDKKYIKNIIELLEQKATIPFIARYRKDQTGNITDTQLLRFQEIYNLEQNLHKRVEQILNILQKDQNLTPKLKEQILGAKTLVELEDIYEPYKKGKNKRDDIAKEAGLEPLANMISSKKYTKQDIKQKAKQFLTKNIDTIEKAIGGAKDIIASRYANDIKTKEILRTNIRNYGKIVTKATKTFDKNGLYKNLAKINTKGLYIKSYQLFAILRGVEQKQLSLKIEIDENYLIQNVKNYILNNNYPDSKEYIYEAYVDGLKRLLLPSLKREYLSLLKQKASDEAIEIFGKNLQELLLTPPLVGHVILGVDPAYRSGTKLAVINKDGDYQDSAILDLLNNNKIKQNQQKVIDLINKYNITTIAIGNGTASYETVQFFKQLKDDYNLLIDYAVVSEIGASVYSASKIAQQEYPKLDVTIRGAISIAQRLRDPLSTLVKIDPKSLGVGQYQHDVDQKKLQQKLDTVIGLTVNKIGVDINSGSYKLISYISGIGEKLAQNIVEHRNRFGKFKTKTDILDIKGMGTKAYNLSVGFFRIKDGKSFFDNRSIHPESYQLANYIKTNYNLDDITQNIKQQLCSRYNIGLESLNDIIDELKQPSYLTQEKLTQVSYCEEINSIDQLKVGQKVDGVVRNITDFGAFIDIGLKNDALLHISKYSHNKIKHLLDHLHINQQLNNITIDQIDIVKNKISLSMLD